MLTNQFRQLLALWPIVLAPHFIRRSQERGFDPSWLSILDNGSWRPDPASVDRFVVEGEIAPRDWWRLAVVLSTETNTIVVLTVYPISAAQVVA